VGGIILTGGLGMGFRRGFTLIELLMVIGIMITLGAIMIPTISIAITKAKKAKTASVLGNLRGAIEQFHGRNGFYPMDGAAGGDDPVANNPLLRAALEQVNADDFGLRGAMVTDGQILDAWLEPIRYQHFLHYPTATDHPRYGVRENSYQLWSCGPDGEDDDGRDDDQTNWVGRD
jgi:general secretion pathway protein G